MVKPKLLNDRELIDYLHNHKEVYNIRQKSYDWYGTMNFNSLDRSELEELCNRY